MQLSAGRLAGMVGGTRRLREVAPPPFAPSRSKPAVCLLCCAESACSPQLWYSAVISASVTVAVYTFCHFLTVLISLSFCLFSFILTHTLFLFLSFMVPLSPLPSQAHPLFSPPPLPAHASHSVARIMTLLTTQTHGGSGYGPAKSSVFDINQITGTSLQFRVG